MATKPQRDEVLKASAASPKPFKISDPGERLAAENANYYDLMQAKTERSFASSRMPPVACA